eukprot:Gb_10361 [translate_table: standard]
MGVKVALRRKEGNPDVVQNLSIDLDVQSVQNSGASTNKIVEKPRRNKGLEKSVLDDIMGDPDDFGDLGDLDAGSESDGGRWEDTLRAASFLIALLDDFTCPGTFQTNTVEDLD